MGTPHWLRGDKKTDLHTGRPGLED